MVSAGKEKNLPTHAGTLLSSRQLGVSLGWELEKEEDKLKEEYPLPP